MTTILVTASGAPGTAAQPNAKASASGALLALLPTQLFMISPFLLPNFPTNDA